MYYVRMIYPDMKVGIQTFYLYEDARDYLNRISADGFLDVEQLGYDIYCDETDTVVYELDGSNEDAEEFEEYDYMDGDHDSAMASAGWGTDEDYGCYDEE